jgi:hypothetical protein
MTDNTRSDTDVSTAAAFNDALTELLQRAHASGVHVQGTWECRADGGDTPDWGVDAVELDDGN